ncbi:ZmpA/ZmpB/ZmpC family metallo-endopeptidase [Streptococcus suis]|uniref:ZmpA/ZmpB/ZmpC family metallo-endopeptidase n=1 Tax=Streptococcus suis TaxID=1307 RepID=UPI00301029B2
MNLNFLQKKHHFGIRKFSIGVVSVALAISFSVLGGQVAAAQEVSQVPTSSQQTSQSVTDEPSQQQETNEVAVQTPETVGSLLNEATQENLAQESQLVEVEPAIQKEVVSQGISAPQAALPAEEQSNPAGDENILPVENFHQVAEPVEPDPIQTKQEPAGSTDEAIQPVQPTETAAVATPTVQVSDQVAQPVLRSARRARSVAVTEVAKLPLDAQGQLMTSVSGATVHKFQVLNSDGSSQIVEAQATDQIQKTSDISDKVNQIKQELSAITYESLYPSLNNYERIYDKTDMDSIIAKENPGRTYTEAEKVVLRNKYYMDQLDMRDSFTRVQGDLEHILTGLFEKSKQVDIETIKTNKEKVLLGLTYLDRQFSFKFGNYQAKDLILYHPEVFGGTGDVLTNLYAIGSQNYQDLLLAQSATTFKNKVAGQLGQTDVFSFVEKGLSIFDKDKTDSEWLKEESKALIVEAANSYGPTTTLYEKFKSDTRLANHLLPLLSLPSESVYVLSTSNTVSYGLTETYLGQAPATADFKQKLSDYAYHQQEFLNFWHRMTQRKQEFANHPPIIVVDTVQKYGQPGNARDLYSPKFGSTVLKGVREFIAPLNLYANFVFAGGQASGTSRMNNFLYKLLTNDGHEVYTHELTHMLDKTIWLNGYGRRSGQLQEVFARGLFESRNMSAATVSDPIFNLNTAYTISGARTQNSHPNRFQTTEDMKTYMQGVLDVIYTLDYAEAEAILKQTADDRAVLLNQIRLVPDTTNTRGGMTEEVLPIDASTAANLQTVADFVDQGMISGRYKLNGMATRGVAKTNQYHTIPLFEPIYAALQNDTGSGGDISFKRNAYEILGEYGYENGMVAYLSDKHANDQAALNAIMPEYNGNLVTFKKAMFDRRIAKVSQLKSTSEASDFAAIQSEMDKAIAKDLQQLKANANNNVLLSTGVNAVRDLKNKIFQAYLQATDEFRTSIYSEPKARELYVTNGAENSTDGQGTETNPYQSLSYALSQAKDGDTIKLVNDILHRDGQNFVTNFVIDKAVTIDGRGNKLNLRGLNLLTKKDVTLTNLKLEMIPDGGQQPKIYADGNHLTFDNVSTTISQAQTDLRPILIAGSLTDNPSGSHARISIIGGSSDTRFHQIFAGNAQGTSLIPVDIVIDSEFAKVDQGIDLGGVDGSQTIDRVTLESNSSNIKKVVATNSSDNHVTLKAARIFGVELADVQELTLRERADITLSDKVSSITTRLELGTSSLLNLAMNQNLEVGELTGDGKLIIPASSSLQVTGDIQGSVQVLVRCFEQNLAQNVNKEYVTVDGGVTPSASISLENDFNRFVLSKEGTIYRLTEPTQTPQNLQINLRFKEGETVVKEESLTLQVGSSVTDLVARLPQPAQGHYEIASSFDQTQLNNLQISQTIEIPLELITPALPVKVFDKTAVAGLELVTPPTKTDYRPAETVELAGLQVKLVDNQGLSKTITPDQFKEYGVEVVPVTLTPQVTSLQLRKDTHEVAIPIQVTPWKADVYSVTVGDKYVYETDDDLTAVGTAILAKVQVDAQAGPVERSLVNPLPTTLGEHTIPVLVRFDDGSQEQVFVQVIVQKTENGKGVTHELPVGVLPKSDLYQAQVTGTAQVLPTSTSEATTAEILKQISLPTAAGQVDFEVVGSLPHSSGDYSITVRVVYDDRSQEEVAVPLHILFVENGKGVKHELPEGVLPKSDHYQAQVTGTAQVLPTSTSEATTAEILKQISLPPAAGQVYFEVVGSLPHSSGDYSITVRVVYDDRSQEEVAVPLHILFVENGKGVKHELPEGVLPKSDLYQAQVTGTAQVLPTSTSEATTAEILKQISLPPAAGQVYFEVIGSLPHSSGDYSITVRVVYDDRSQEEVAVPLHILFVENGKGVKHELPEGVLPPLETGKGEGVTHELPVGVLPPLEVAKGTFVVSEKGTGENSPKPAAKEMAVPVSAVEQKQLSNRQLPETGDKNDLVLVGLMLALFNLVFLKHGKKSHHSLYRGDEK